MKLRNKQTGEIVEVITGDTFEVGGLQIRSLKRNPQIVRYYPSLAELNEEWEDYEEPKEYWCIREDGVVNKRPYPIVIECTEQENRDAMREIGNYFETEEEAEKAVEKLKAWKRLKDKGFRFTGWQDLEACDEVQRMIANHIVDGENIIGFRMDDYHDCLGDLNSCFGGEE